MKSLRQFLIESYKCIHLSDADKLNKKLIKDMQSVTGNVSIWNGTGDDGWWSFGIKFSGDESQINRNKNTFRKEYSDSVYQYCKDFKITTNEFYDTMIDFSDLFEECVGASDGSIEVSFPFYGDQFEVPNGNAAIATAAIFRAVYAMYESITGDRILDKVKKLCDKYISDSIRKSYEDEDFWQNGQD